VRNVIRPFNIVPSLSQGLGQWTCPCVKWYFYGAREQFWLDALPDSTKDSYGCQQTGSQVSRKKFQHLNYWGTPATLGYNLHNATFMWK